jgi:hypothetical protein
VSRARKLFSRRLAQRRTRRKTNQPATAEACSFEPVGKHGVSSTHSRTSGQLQPFDNGVHFDFNGSLKRTSNRCHDRSRLHPMDAQVASQCPHESTATSQQRKEWRTLNGR